MAQYGFTKGTSSHALPWGKPIREGKRYGLASGRRFNMNKFKAGAYTSDTNKRFGMASGRRFNKGKFLSGNYMAKRVQSW